MGCCVEDAVRVSKMALELKSGPMLWHKRRFFGSNWRDVHCVLYNDSSLLWYRDRSLDEQEGGVVLKDAPELIAFGPYTSTVPDRPSLPDNYEQKQMLAFGVRGKDIVYWFLCPNEAEVQSWMAAIAGSMPAPPEPPQQSYPQEPPQQSYPPQSYPPQSATAPGSQENQLQPIPTAHYIPPTQPPPPRYTPVQHQQMPAYGPQPPSAIPGQYPSGGMPGYRPPPYQGYNTVHPQPYSNPNAGGTTVVVQQDRPSGGAFGGGAASFGMGMLAGGVLGTAWGSSLNHGFGGHGYGHGGGWGGTGPQVHDTDVTINNYYDNDTSVVNNNLDMTNNMATEQPQMATEQPHMPFVQPQEEQDAGEVIMGDMIPVDDGGDMFGGGDFDGDFGGGDFGDF